MKTLFVCSDRKINTHVGEEYDFILEVPDQPTTENIADWAARIRTRIRSMWKEQEGTPDAKVVCHLDGPTPYNAILNNLQIIMKAEENIVIELPYMANLDMTVKDPETIDLLKKLDANNR